MASTSEKASALWAEFPSEPFKALARALRNSASLEVFKMMVMDSRCGVHYRGNIDSWSSLKDVTLLFLALEKQRWDAFQWLLRVGADIEATNTTRQTTLQMASYRGRPEWVDCLLAEGANTEGEVQTALTMAVMGGSLETVKSLVDSGAELDTTNAKGLPLTALYRAMQVHAYEIAEYLLAEGATISDLNGVTPLHIACERVCPRTNLYSMLLGPGNRDLNAVTPGGLTPLHLAAAMANEYAVKVLTQRGADTNARDKDGATPSDLFERRGIDRVVRGPQLNFFRQRLNPAPVTE